MTAYDQIFYPVFGAGCAIAAIVSLLAARMRGIVVPAALLVVGVVSFWAGLFLGSEFGYQAWQSIPNPPDEAFSDTFPMGALLAGWVPGGVFCGFVFGIARLAVHLVSGRAPVPETVERDSNSVETGNPYQAP